MAKVHANGGMLLLSLPVPHSPPLRVHHSPTHPLGHSPTATPITNSYSMHESIMTKSEEYTENQAAPDATCMCINWWTVLYLFLCVAGVGGIITGIVMMCVEHTSCVCWVLPS
jgi:hypothetical protein